MAITNSRFEGKWLLIHVSNENGFTNSRVEEKWLLLIHVSKENGYY
jgi:hypothetical protein